MNSIRRDLGLGFTLAVTWFVFRCRCVLRSSCKRWLVIGRASGASRRQIKRSFGVLDGYNLRVGRAANDGCDVLGWAGFLRSATRVATSSAQKEGYRFQLENLETLRSIASAEDDADLWRLEASAAWRSRVDRLPKSIRHFVHAATRLVAETPRYLHFSKWRYLHFSDWDVIGTAFYDTGQDVSRSFGVSLNVFVAEGTGGHGMSQVLGRLGYLSYATSIAAHAAESEGYTFVPHKALWPGEARYWNIPERSSRTSSSAIRRTPTTASTSAPRPNRRSGS